MSYATIPTIVDPMRLIPRPVRKMDPVVKQKWLEALRNGEYAQGKQRLNRNNEFCCLGVLCDLYGKEKETNWWRPEERQNDGTLSFLNEMVYIPKEVMEWAKLSNAYGMINEVADLAAMNDGGNTFEEIATVIEEHL